MVSLYRKHSVQDLKKKVELEMLWQQMNSAQCNPALKLKDLLNTWGGKTSSFRNIF